MESFLSQWGLAAVFLFGFLEACCIPIPSEITFGFAGVLAGEGKLNILAVIIVGTLAELIGSYVSYTVGRVAERPLVSRFGRYLLITERDIDRAERFLAGRGAWAVPVGRALPVVRTFISIVAGFTKMPALLFGVLSLIGTAIWVTVISLLGYSLSSTWQSISHGIAVAGYLIAAVAVLAIVALVLHRLREIRRQAPAGGGHAPGRDPARRSAQAQVAHVIGGQVGQPARGHLVPRAAFHDHRHPDDLRSSLPQRVHRGQHGIAGGRGVLDGQNPAPGDVGTLDAPLQAVRLPLFPHNECIQRLTRLARGVHHRGRNRVCAQGQPAYRRVVEARGEIAHHPAGQCRAGPAEQYPAQVDVPGRALPGGQHEIAVHHGLVLDQTQQVLAVAHG